MRVFFAGAGIFALLLQGCILFNEYDYGDIVFEQPVCSSNDCTWSKRIGGQFDQSPRAVALHENGDLLVAGRFKGQIGLGLGSLSSASAVENSPFAVRYDIQGKPLCLYTFPQVDLGEALSVLPVGDQLIWGGQLGAPNDNGYAFLRLAKTCGASTPLGNTFNSAPIGRISSLVLSNDKSSVYAAGTLLGSGQLDCGSTPVTYLSMGTSLFISEIEIASGECRWARVYTGGYHVPESIQMIRGGPYSLLVGGSYTGVVEQWPMTTEAYGGAFVMAIDASNGNPVAANAFRAADNDSTELATFRSLAVRGKQVVFVGENRCDQMIDITNAPIHDCTLTETDAFIALLNLETLSTESVTAIRGMGAQTITGLAVDENSHVHLAGLIDSELAFEAGGTPTPCIKARCSFLAKLSEPTAAPDSVRILSSLEQNLDANVLLTANHAGLGLAAGSSVTMSATPDDSFPSAEGTGYLDVVLARFFPPP